MEGRSAVFSQFSGKPWTLGNGSMDKEMDFGCLEILRDRDGAFNGVVMMVTFRPRWARAMERSIRGMV